MANLTDTVTQRDREREVYQVMVQSQQLRAQRQSALDTWNTSVKPTLQNEAQNDVIQASTIETANGLLQVVRQAAEKFLEIKPYLEGQLANLPDPDMVAEVQAEIDLIP